MCVHDLNDLGTFLINTVHLSPADRFEYKWLNEAQVCVDVVVYSIKRIEASAIEEWTQIKSLSIYLTYTTTWHLVASVCISKALKYVEIWTTIQSDIKFYFNDQILCFWKCSYDNRLIKQICLLCNKTVTLSDFFYRGQTYSQW